MIIQSGSPVSILSARGTLNRTARSGQNTVDTTANLDQLKAATGLFMTGNGPYFVDPSHIGPDGRGVAPDGADPFPGQIFFNPQPGTLGSLQRRILDGPWYKNYNFSVQKDTRITERQSIQFRADFFNVFNHPNFCPGPDCFTRAGPQCEQRELRQDHTAVLQRGWRRPACSSSACSTGSEKPAPMGGLRPALFVVSGAAALHLWGDAADSLRSRSRRAGRRGRRSQARGRAVSCASPSSRPAAATGLPARVKWVVWWYATAR